MLGLGLSVNKGGAPRQLFDIILYQTNFSNGGALPDGWTVSHPDDWVVDNNSDYFPNSSGYAGASGGYKLVCLATANDWPYIATYQTGFSTIGKNNIRVSIGTIVESDGYGIMVEYSLNGSDWVNCFGGTLGAESWGLSSTTPAVAALSNQANVKIRAYYVDDFIGFKMAIDDVKILGDLIQ